MTRAPKEEARASWRARLRVELLASLREAFVADDPLGPDARRWLAALAALAALAFFALAWARYQSFHNRNFDLAFYARLAWGAAHHDGWEPIVGAHVWGLHFVWALEVLGRIGALVGEVPTLLAAQSLALALASWPLARVGARLHRVDPRSTGAAQLGVPLAVALVWLLQPNLWHVASAEFHPGTLAVLPLAWAMDALHRRSAHGLAWSALLVLACREDLALVLVGLGLAFALATRTPRDRRAGLTLSACAFAYIALFLGFFHPRYAPATGSFELHYARWGRGPLSAILGVLADPIGLIAWLALPERAPYLLVVTAPLAFLPFLAPEWMLLALPILGMNLLSSFPTTLFLDSHYLTPALPILAAAALVGSARLTRLLALVRIELPRLAGLAPLTAAALLAHLVAGGSPLSARYDRAAYRPDRTSAALTSALALVPPDASIQAPERALAHVAARRIVRRGPPPEALTRFVLLDAWRRRVDAHTEALLRTDEEPLVRDWLAREDHALRYARDGIYLLERGAPNADDVARRHVVGVAGSSEGRPLTSCLALLDARLEPLAEGAALALTLGARGSCPSDLALRIGWGYRPGRVDLIADGELSPARFRAGDRIRSRHALSAAELRAIQAHGLRIGAIRASGARPEHADPVALDVPLEPRAGERGSRAL